MVFYNIYFVSFFVFIFWLDWGLGAAQGGENEPWEGKELAVGTALGVLAGLVWALLLDAGCTLCLCLGLLLL